MLQKQYSKLRGDYWWLKMVKIRIYVPAHYKYVNGRRIFVSAHYKWIDADPYRNAFYKAFRKRRRR